MLKTLIFSPIIILIKLLRRLRDTCKIYSLHENNDIDSQNKPNILIAFLATILYFTFKISLDIIEKVFYRIANIFEFNSNSLHTALIIAFAIFGLHAWILSTLILIAHSYNTESLLFFLIFESVTIPASWVAADGHGYIVQIAGIPNGLNELLSSILLLTLVSIALFFLLCDYNNIKSNDAIFETRQPRDDKTIANFTLILIITSIALPEILSIYTSITIPAIIAKITLSILLLGYCLTCFLYTYTNNSSSFDYEKTIAHDLEEQFHQLMPCNLFHEGKNSTNHHPS